MFYWFYFIFYFPARMYPECYLPHSLSAVSIRVSPWTHEYIAWKAALLADFPFAFIKKHKRTASQIRSLNLSLYRYLIDHSKWKIISLHRHKVTECWGFETSQPTWCCTTTSSCFSGYICHIPQPPFTRSLRWNSALDQVHRVWTCLARYSSIFYCINVA